MSTSDDNGMLVVEEPMDHDSSSGARRAAGCATSSSGKDINVGPAVVVVVVLVVVLLARRLPSCLPRSAKTPASFTEPVTHNDAAYNSVGLPLTRLPLKKVTVISFFRGSV